MSRGVSIRFRLTLLYTAILAVTVVAFSLVVYATQSRSTYAGIKANLQRQAALFPNPARPGPSPSPAAPNQGGEGAPPDSGAPVTAPSGMPEGTLPGRWTQTRSLSGMVTGQTFDLSGDTLPLSAEGLKAVQAGAGWFETAKVQDEPLLVFSQTYTAAGGETGIVQVAFPIGQPAQYLTSLRLMLIVGSSLAVVVAFVLGWAVAGAALRPIQQITSTARSIGAERDFTRRVTHDGPADEVGQLAVTFNEMLAELESGYRQLEEALQSQRRFVADASHELRTPLTTVRGNIELLRHKPIAAAERAEILSDTTEEVDRLIRLVNQLLVLARADAGKALRQDEIAIAPVIEDVCRQARTLAPHTPVQTDAPDNIVLLGDRDALKQVLLILVDNALVHTPAGTPVTVAASVVGGMVNLTVHDGGPGIPADALPHVFERFYRVQASRTGRGAGLGLSIAKELVSAQGGTIAAGNRPGGGAVFTVTLPAV